MTSVRLVLPVAALGLSVVLAARPHGQTQPAASPCAPIVACRPVNPDRVAWLADFSGQSSRDVIRHSRYDDLIDDVAPSDVTFHLGTDMPLALALKTILTGTGQPVSVRDGRYVLVSACRSPACSARAFIWADVRSGLLFGGIEFNPTNGEPAPTETIFSAAVGERVTGRPGLPAAFVEDLAPWERASRLRSPLAHYFIGRDGRKWLLPNEDEACRGADRNSLQATLCTAADLDAAEKDVDAAFFLLLGAERKDSAARAAVQADQDRWLHDRAAGCPGGPTSPVAAACLLRAARDRVKQLTDAYAR